MQDMESLLVMLCNGIGQLAIIAILLGTLQRRKAGPLARTTLSAALFAICGLLAMADPTRFPDGVVLDLRGVIVGLAGAFAGWPAALAAATATALYRIHLGGIYAAGCASIALAAVLGLLWRWRSRDLRQTRSRRLAELGVLIALHPLPLIAVPATWTAGTLVPTLATLLVASLAGSFAFGKLWEREQRLIAQERNLTREALHDPLTNLLNRRGFEAAFLDARSLDQDAPLALLLVDIDHFKSINDRYGHDRGDEVLRAVAGSLRSSAGPFERASRHGGEEFALLLPRTDAASAIRRAEAVRTAIAHLGVPMDTVETIRATISVGVASCEDGRTSLTELLRKADEALYQAKRTGRDRSVLFGAAPTQDPAQVSVPAAALAARNVVPLPIGPSSRRRAASAM